MRPSCSTAKSSPMTRALGMLCVTTTSVVPPRLVSTSSSSISVGRDRIEPGARLVDEQDRRIERHRAGEPGALLHAAGQVARHLVVRRSRARRRRASSSRARGSRRRPVLVWRRIGKRDVVADRHRVEQRRVLKQEAHVLAHLAELAPGQRRDVAFFDEHVAAVRLHQADDVPERDALAGAASSQQAEGRCPSESRTTRRRGRRARRSASRRGRTARRRRPRVIPTPPDRRRR